MNIEWTYKCLSWKVIKYLDTHAGILLNRNRYCGKRIVSVKETNDAIKKMILDGKPFAAGRIGGTELKAMKALQPYQKDQSKVSEAYSLLQCLSGFFGTEEEFVQFGRVMEKSLGSIDIIGVWYNQMEDYMIKHYGKDDVVIGKLEGLEPWYVPEDPWTAALKGKKVVCVHPFEDSIKSQYAKREMLFKGTDILPEFDLRCVKAVQTLYGEEDNRFNTWFEALDYMYEQVMKEDFDVALISCGAYGLPLAAKIRDAGKQAVHVGGALQLLFGVKGSRWDDFDKMQPFYSDAWEYPLQSEHLTGDRSENVEHGCYW